MCQKVGYSCLRSYSQPCVVPGTILLATKVSKRVQVLVDQAKATFETKSLEEVCASQATSVLPSPLLCARGEKEAPHASGHGCRPVV